MVNHRRGLLSVFVPQFKVGKLVRLFVLADLALLAGWGLVGPIFSLFIIERIEGATIITVGIAAAVYWITKSVIQLPIAQFLDFTPSEKDDFIVLIMGLIIAGFSALGFVYIFEIWHLYVLESIHAFGFALYAPAWAGIFSRHLDKSHEATEWSLDNAALSFSAGVTGLASGVLVSLFGFNSIFILTSFFSFVSAGIIFSVPDVVFPHRLRIRRGGLRDHRPITQSSNV